MSQASALRLYDHCIQPLGTNPRVDSWVHVGPGGGLDCAAHDKAQGGGWESDPFLEKDFLRWRQTCRWPVRRTRGCGTSKNQRGGRRGGTSTGRRVRGGI